MTYTPMEGISQYELLVQLSAGHLSILFIDHLPDQARVEAKNMQKVQDQVKVIMREPSIICRDYRVHVEVYSSNTNYLHPHTIALQLDSPLSAPQQYTEGDWIERPTSASILLCRRYQATTRGEAFVALNHAYPCEWAEDLGDPRITQAANQ